jgi:hypothetical protein
MSALKTGLIEKETVSTRELKCCKLDSLKKAKDGISFTHCLDSLSVTLRINNALGMD